MKALLIHVFTAFVHLLRTNFLREFLLTYICCKCLCLLEQNNNLFKKKNTLDSYEMKCFFNQTHSHSYTFSPLFGINKNVYYFYFFQVKLTQNIKIFVFTRKFSTSFELNVYFKSSLGSFFL